MLLAVRNPDNKSPKAATLTLDLDKLGLTPQLPWQEFISVRDFGRTQGELPSTLGFYAPKLTVPNIKA